MDVDAYFDEMYQKFIHKTQSITICDSYDIFIELAEDAALFKLKWC